LLAILDGDPEQYRQFARDYYAADLPRHAIDHVYRLRSLTDDVLRALNGDVTLEAVRADGLKIGYPIAPA
jgi:hypothetical protein